MEVDSVGILRVEGAPLSSRVDVVLAGPLQSISQGPLGNIQQSPHSNAEDSLLNRAEPAFRLRAWGQNEETPMKLSCIGRRQFPTPMTTTGSSTNGMDRGCTPSTRTKPCSCSDSYSTRCSRVTLIGIVGQKQPKKSGRSKWLCSLLQPFSAQGHGWSKHVHPSAHRCDRLDFHEIFLQSTHIRGHCGFVVMHRDGCDATLRSRSIG